MLNELLGRIAYEAAAKVTNCEQPWEEANKEKWKAAAWAVAARMREEQMHVFVFHPDDPALKMLPEGTMVILQRHVYTPNVEHNRRTAASSPGVRVDGPVGPHRTGEKYGD